ncbi:MAG TPA: AI-2E family transporter [Acidimicrobiales bacterium]|jgi:predicted PurR-regulated permease PerM
MADDTSPESRRDRLLDAAAARGVPLAAILTTVVVVAVAYLAAKLVYKLREIVLLMVVAGFVALLLNPAVVLLQRWKVRRRGLAVAVVTVLFALALAGLAALFGYPLVNGITHLTHKLPAYVKQVEQGKGALGHLARKYHVQRWVDKNLVPKLSTFAKNLSKPALTLGKAAVNLLFALFLIFVLVLLLLLEGPKLRRGLLGMMRPERAARVWRVSGEVSRSVTGFMLGNFITSVIAGLVVFVTLFILNVPFAFLWALWVALFDFLPMIGGAVAGIPTAAFALTHSFGAFIVFAVVFLTYTQVENHILNPIVMSRTVRINPLLVLIAVLTGANIGDLVGGFFGGFVGTLLAIPVAGAIQVVVRELWQSTSPEAQLEIVGGGRVPPSVP